MGTVILADVSNLSTIKISELAEVTELDVASVLPVNKNSVTRKVRPQNLLSNGYWVNVVPFLDENYSNFRGAPTQVAAGLFRGYSLPIWETPSQQYEELLFRMHVPYRWDGVTNPFIMLVVANSLPETIGSKYSLQFEYATFSCGSIIPGITTKFVTTEVTVSSDKAYCASRIFFEVDSSDLISGQHLQARLRRIASAAPAITGEVVVFHWSTHWKINKAGTLEL